MLGLQDSKERLAEGFLGAACTLAGYRYGFVRARRRLVLDQVFEVIIVNVDWVREVVSWSEPRRVIGTTVTHNGPIQECSFGAMYRRISCPRLRM